MVPKFPPQCPEIRLSLNPSSLGRQIQCPITNNNKITSDVLEHKWRASLKTILFLYLTSNTEATENKVQFLNLAYRVKGFQCHSNNWKEKNNI